METLTRIKMDATFEVEPEELLETGEHPEPTLRAIVLSFVVEIEAKADQQLSKLSRSLPASFPTDPFSVRSIRCCGC